MDSDGIGDTIDNCPLVANPGQENSNYATGLISYRNFDESDGIYAVDSIDANHGRLIDGPTWTTGIVGGALNFDGSDDYVSMENAANLNLTDKISLAARVKSNEDNDAGLIIGKTSCSDPSHQSYRLYQNHNDIYFALNGGSMDDLTLVASASIGDGLWHFVTATWDKDAGDDNQKIYIDGMLVNQQTTPVSNLDTLDWPTEIGGQIESCGSSSFFNGLIDEVAIYDRALSSDEVQQDYQTSLSGHRYDDDGIGDACDCTDAICTQGTDYTGNLICSPIEYACTIIDGSLSFIPDQSYTTERSIQVQLTVAEPSEYELSGDFEESPLTGSLTDTDTKDITLTQ
jgi:hypothetical protein